MKLRPIAANQTELQLASGDVTTSRHVNQWLRSQGATTAQEVPQEALDALTDDPDRPGRHQSRPTTARAPASAHGRGRKSCGIAG